jgi:predicted Zn finger-like uncharacterized protein
MPISVTCPKCQATYRLADDMAGKKLKCQKCNGAITVPLHDAAPPQKAKTGGRMMVVLLSFLGIGLCICLPCVAGLGVWLFGLVPVVPGTEPPVPVAVKKVVNDPEKNPQAKYEKPAKKADDAKGKGIPAVDGKKTGPAIVGDKETDPPPTYTPVSGYSYRSFAFNNGTRLVGDLVWARDHQSCYALTEAGQLLQFNLDTGATLVEKVFAQKCGNLALSGPGLLVSMVDAQEVWLVDPANLNDVKKKIPVPALTRVTAGSDAGYAVAAGKMGLSVLDLDAGAVVKSFPDFAARHIRASPDGRFVFAQGNAEQLVRYRLDNDQLVQEDAGPRIALNGQSVCISPDSRYVCLAAADGNGQGHPDHQPASRHATFIYPATNLKRPLCVLDSGPNPQAVGFDPKAGFIVAQNNAKAIVIFMYNGNKRAEFEVKDIKGSDVREFSVSPRGFEMLVRTDDRVIHVKFTRK